MSLREHARGRWPLIVSEILGEVYANTRKHHACPGTCDGKKRFRLSDKTGTGNFFCHCSEGESDGFDLMMCAKGITFAEAAREVERVIGKSSAPADVKKQTRAERLRNETISTRRSAYLESRGLEVPPGLEWHRSLDYFDGDGKKVGAFPAMLAPVYRGNTWLTYHATWLQDGAKAPVDPARKILPGPPATGGACPLYRPAPVMGIAEGVETAIAAKMISGIPVWAALNTALMAAFEPPEIVERLVIYADHDENYAGHAAAYRLAHRMVLRGIKVEIEMPDHVGQDWNDVILGRASA